jgi:hypothetical protein
VDTGPDAKPDTGPSCTAKTCLDLAADCGKAPDGCGGVVACGTCLPGQTCGAAGQNRCGVGSCWPESCLSIAAACGVLSNGCDDVLLCGTCPAPQVCDTQSAPAQCVCAPQSCLDEEASCGQVPDTCGNVLECGVCQAGETCGGGWPNMCGTGTCSPASCLGVEASCGAVADGCGKVLDCGTCPAGQLCGGAGVINACGCTPRTCAGMGVECGDIDNGCAATVPCGTCPFPTVCGGHGIEGRCGAIQEPSTGATTHVATWGGTGDEDGYDVAVAADGTVYATGQFASSVTIGSTTLTSKGLDDVYVAAFDPDLTPRWAKSFGSFSSDRGQGIAVDLAGRVYVCGLFGNTPTFAGKTMVSKGSFDMFLVSYEADGTERWSRTAGGTNMDLAYDLAVEPSGNILLTGYYEGAVDFGVGPLTAFGSRDIFVAKYDANGALAWSKGWGSAQLDTGLGIATNAQGHVVVTGSLGDAVDFGTGPIGAAGGSFLIKLDSGGTDLWSLALANIVTWDVAVDQKDGRVLVGARSATGSDPGTGPLPDPPGGNDILVLAYDTQPQLLWHREFGGALADIGLGITTDAFGNTYTIGMGGTDIDFGGGLVTGHGDQDIVVTSHDPAGNLNWGRMFGGALQDRGYGVAVAPDGAIYITGRYSGTSDFGSTGTTPAIAGNDAFLVRLK